MDKIHIRDLALRCIIGIFPDERKNKQDVIVNVELGCVSFDAATASDAIEDTVDYKQITKDIIRLVESSDFHLIETLAERIAERALQHERVLEAGVTVDKPGALRFSRSVAVEIRRSRG